MQLAAADRRDLVDSGAHADVAAAAVGDMENHLAQAPYAQRQAKCEQGSQEARPGPRILQYRPRQQERSDANDEAAGLGTGIAGGGAGEHPMDEGDGSSRQQHGGYDDRGGRAWPVLGDEKHQAAETDSE